MNKNRELIKNLKITKKKVRNNNLLRKNSPGICINYPSFKLIKEDFPNFDQVCELYGGNTDRTFYWEVTNIKERLQVCDHLIKECKEKLKKESWLYLIFRI